MTPEEEPFAPRLRWRAFLREMRRRRPAEGGWNLLALAALAGLLFAFWRVFEHMRRVKPEGQPGSGSRLVFDAGGDAIAWLLVGALCAALLGRALHSGGGLGPVRWRRRGKGPT